MIGISIKNDWHHKKKSGILNGAPLFLLMEMDDFLNR